MAAGDRIYSCTSAGTLTEATHVLIEPSTVVLMDPGDADSPGPLDFLVTDFALGVTVFGEDDAELLALVGATAADFEIGVTGAAGTAETLTVADLYFDDAPGEMLVSAADEEGPVARFSVVGHVNWEDGETFADKLTSA